MEFNSSKDSYRRTIEEQIAFAGKGHDFYTRVKADHALGVIARQLPGTQHPDVLDIGCGHGYIHPMLAAAGCRVTGVETADEVLELAREDNPDNTYIHDDAVLLRHTELRTLLRDAGFSEVRSRFIRLTPFTASVFRRLDAALGWLPLGAQYGAIGTRA